MDTSEFLVFDHLQKNMTDGVFIIGYDGHIRMENNVAAGMIDVKDGALSGKTIMNLIEADSKNDTFFECILDAIYQKKAVQDIVPFYRESGTSYLRLTASPLRDRKDDIAVIVMFQDVTRLEELNRENESLNKQLLEFINRLVRVLIGAIDRRSHYNANHTRSMVGYATRYLEYLDRSGRGLSKEKWAPLIASVWMHDIGKLVIPLEVMDKPTRLAGRENDIKTKIDISILSEKLRIFENPDDESVRRDAEEHIKSLKEAMDYILDINSRGFVDDAVIERINELSELKCINISGELIPLLDDYELEALTVRRGTLTKDERKIIESHVIHTYDLLQELKFEGIYKDVPKWAGKHHEYLDGSGYPNGLKGDEITWETRILTIIDIYDALTAEDRPYKPPIPPERAFNILKEMSAEGKIDSEILNDFYESKAWIVHDSEKKDEL